MCLFLQLREDQEREPFAAKERVEYIVFAALGPAFGTIC